MAYTPNTWVNDDTGGTAGASGGQLNAARLNHMETGIDSAHDTADAAVPKSIVDAAGDLIVGSGADAVARLAVGSDGQVLTVSSGAPAWATVGGGITTYRKTTEKDVANTTSETDLLNGEITIGAGVMGTNKMLRATLLGDYLNNVGSNATSTIRIKLGGTTIYEDTITVVTGATRHGLRIAFEIMNLGANNSQFMVGLFAFSAAGGATTGLGDLAGAHQSVTGSLGAVHQVAPIASNGTTSIDTSAACALVVSVQHGSANAAISARLKAALVEIL